MRILYIDIDACRPDHLGCYGYHRNTSPHIDALAREGMRFDGYHTSDAPCLPSRSALYSGRFGIQSGVVGHGGTAANPKVQGPGRGFQDLFDDQGLAGRLRKLGYHTAMISPFGQRHSAHWFYAGFKEIHNTGRNGMESAHEVWPTVESWLDRRATDDSWFLHVNFWDPHTPYRAPAEYGEPFANDPLPEWLQDESVLARHRNRTGPHTAQDIGMYNGTALDAGNFPRHPWTLQTQTDLRRMIDGYDTAIRYVDDYVGRIVEALKQAGVYEDTAIIISSDHGENQGELGIYGEHGTADAITCRVPLIVRWPGGATGTNPKFHYNVDLAPTIMELLGAPASPIWDGQSFAAAVRDGDTATGREEIVISQCAHVCQRGVRWQNWLYIRSYFDGFHLFPDEMLFDLQADPYEQNDLATERPDMVREGAWRLARWHDAQMKKMAATCSDVTDPLWTVMREGGPFHARTTLPGAPGGMTGLARYIERLEATGRSDGAAVLRQRYAEKLADL
jgi:choline-sulfatase